MSTELLSLPDRMFLESKYPSHSVFTAGGHVCVVIEDFRLHGLVPVTSDLLIRLPNGYPDRRPDMFWLGDAVKRTDNGPIKAVGQTMTVADRVWHRWSRHMKAEEWAEASGLRAYVGYVRMCLLDAAKQVA
jgi:hypothetical protein